MNLPKVVADLVQAQNEFNSRAYTDCFAETAVVYDEGKVHQGRTEILQWITQSNEQYRSVMKPLDFRESGATGVLSTEVSGTFPGSPIVLQFHFEIRDGLIQTLKVTG